MKKLWFLIIGVFAQLILVAQAGENAGIAMNDTFARSDKTWALNQKLHRTIFVWSRTARVRDTTVATFGTNKNAVVMEEKITQSGPDDRLSSDESKNVRNAGFFEDKSEKWAEAGPNQTLAEEGDDSFLDTHDGKVQAALNWLKNKKGLK